MLSEASSGTVTSYGKDPNKTPTLGTSSRNPLGLGTPHWAKAQKHWTACWDDQDDLNHVKYVRDRSFAPRSTTTTSENFAKVCGVTYTKNEPVHKLGCYLHLPPRARLFPKMSIFLSNLEFYRNRTRISNLHLAIQKFNPKHFTKASLLFLYKADMTTFDAKVGCVIWFVSIGWFVSFLMTANKSCTR